MTLKLTNEQKTMLLTAAYEAGDPIATIGIIIGAELLSVVQSELAGPNGCQVYIQPEERFYSDLMKPLRINDVRATWDGSQEKLIELSDRWGVSPRTIRRDFVK